MEAVPQHGTAAQTHSGLAGSLLPSCGRQRRSGAPLVRSHFDIYFHGNRLVYFKEPCAEADTSPSFFVHLYAADPNDLPRYRMQPGFDNLDHDFKRHGQRLDGKCLTSIPLPDYAIASIEIGQHPIWKAEFCHPDYVADWTQRVEEIVGSGSPKSLIRNFHVYLDGNRWLIYLRDQCAASDVDDRFFLHVIPVHMDSLTGDKRQLGFDNFDIAYIRTGQYDDAGRLWEGRISLGP